MPTHSLGKNMVNRAITLPLVADLELPAAAKRAGAKSVNAFQRGLLAESDPALRKALGERSIFDDQTAESRAEQIASDVFGLAKQNARSMGDSVIRGALSEFQL
jgi:hypothetical protein